MIIIITFLIFYLTLSESYIHSLAVTITLLILHLINIFLLYCILKELMGKFSTPAILLYSSVFFIAMVYFYLHVSDFRQMKFIVSLVNFTFSSPLCFYLSICDVNGNIYTILYSTCRIFFCYIWKKILENELKLKELKSCKIPYIDGKTYKSKDLFGIFKQLEKACTRSNYTVAITTILEKNIIPDSFRDSVLNTFNSIRIPKRTSEAKTFYIRFRNKVNLSNSIITAISIILLIIIYTFTPIIETSYMKSFLFIIYIFIF